MVLSFAFGAFAFKGPATKGAAAHATKTASLLRTGESVLLMTGEVVIVTAAAVGMAQTLIRKN